MTLYIITSRLSMRLWSRICQLRFPSIVVTLEVSSPPGSPALNRLKFVYVSSSVWGHAVRAYSNCGWMRVLYAIDFKS